MPNLRGKEWTTITPANVEDAQYWEDHLISDEDAAKIGTVILPAGGTAGQVLTKQSGSPNDADWDDPASSGHTIEDEDGVVMPYQSTLQFVNAEVTNDSTNSRTVVDCKGAKGDPGPQGPAGTDGFSPAVTITSIPGGHQVNITDEDHPQGQTFNVMDGDGTGDMQASAYDPNNDVYNAGGIPAYLADEIVANPTGTPTDDLTSIQIGSTIYRLSGGGTEIIQIPSVVGDSFTYDGTAQGPTVTGLDSTHCTVTGATAINAGSYTLTIALNDPSSMVWSDLTTADKTYSYTITKAPQTLTASKNSVSLTAQQPSDTVTISGQQGSLNVSSSDTGVATVSESSGIVTITGVSTGTATISIYAEESANYVQSNTVSIAVDVVINITKTITVYSAASDTVSFTDSTGAKTVTTNSSGSGTVSVTIPAGGQNITFTSSVAKNPSDLSDDFSKTVNVTSSTTAVYVMPNNVLYWYGYIGANCESLSSNNEWTFSSGYSGQEPIYNTNKITTDAGYHITRGIGTKNPISTSCINIVGQGITISGTVYGYITDENIKNLNNYNNYTQFISDSLIKISITNLLDNKYVSIYSDNNRSMDIYAFWYE